MSLPTTLLSHDRDALGQLRRRYLQGLAVTGLVAASVGAVVQVIGGSPAPSGLINVGLAFLTSVGLLLLLRWGRTRIASYLLIGISCLILVSAADFGYLLAGTFLVISAAALGNRLVYLAANGVILAKAAYDVWVLMNTTPGDKLLIVIALMIVSVATRYFITQAEKAAESAKSRTNLLQAVAETGEILAKFLIVNELLPQAVEQIRERFAFYHVQIFLVDETGEYAMLAASTGALGQKLMERRHRLAVGSQSVIGTVTLKREPVLARDTDPIYYRNELLPNTRAELAVPIMDGDQLIGALDVQSRRADAFDFEAMQAMQVMANLVGTSIRNARLFEAQARSARETKRLFLEAETNLREIQRLNQQLTGQGWENYLTSRQQVRGVTLAQDEMVQDSLWTETLVRASQSRQAVTDESDGQTIIAVPVMLGNEVIGAIEVEPGSDSMGSESVEMVKAIAQRLALSLDKARLFEESQEATAQEQRINQIVARYQSVSNVDELLQITLAELSQTLGAKRGAIRLGAAQREGVNGTNGESGHV